jgi:hypothetical protein
MVNNGVTDPRLTCTLSKLTSLTVTSPWPGDRIWLGNLNGLLHAAPNLRSLSVEGAESGTTLIARLTNLTTLCLNNSFLEPRGLHLLTQACINLTYFKFTGFRDDEEPGILRISPAEILDCLAPCSARLQKLHLAPVLCAKDRGRYLEQPFELLTTPVGFPALTQVAVDPLAVEPRSDKQGLVNLLRHCPALEGVFLMDVREGTGEDLANIVHAVVDLMLW